MSQIFKIAITPESIIAEASFWALKTWNRHVCICSKRTFYGEDTNQKVVAEKTIFLLFGNTL